jgi:predicted nucleotidyltransferase
MPTPDAATLESAIAQAAEREPDVLAAYLFGSRARGEERERSDLDVGVLEVPGRSLGLESEDRLRRAITAATGLPVDIARMRPSSPVLAFEVLAGGRRVFARDDERADEIEEDLLRRYLDTEHLRRVQREYFFEGKSRRSAGRPSRRDSDVSRM